MEETEGVTLRSRGLSKDGFSQVCLLKEGTVMELRLVTGQYNLRSKPRSRPTLLVVMSLRVPESVLRDPRPIRLSHTNK